MVPTGHAGIVSKRGELLNRQVGYQIPPFGQQDKGDAQRSAVAGLVAVVTQALRDYNTQRHRSMQQACLQLDLSWAKAAEEWEEALMQLVS